MVILPGLGYLTTFWPKRLEVSAYALRGYLTKVGLSYHFLDSLGIFFCNKKIIYVIILVSMADPTCVILTRVLRRSASACSPPGYKFVSLVFTGLVCVNATPYGKC